MIDRKHGWNKSFKPLYIGLTLSLLLLIAVYLIDVHEHLSKSLLTTALLGLGFIQGLVQLVFFLHVGMESKPHWNTVTFLFMLVVLIIIVGGTLWIMQNLNYNVMPR